MMCGELSARAAVLFCLTFETVISKVKLQYKLVGLNGRLVLEFNESQLLHLSSNMAQ